MQRTPHFFEIYGWTCHILLVSLLVGAGLSGCSDDPNGEPVVGSESHFMQACQASRECADGLVCLCGVCTVSCEQQSDCEATGTGSTCKSAGELDKACANSTGGPDAVCMLNCASEQDCDALDPTLTCSDSHVCGREQLPNDPPASDAGDAGSDDSDAQGDPPLDAQTDSSTDTDATVELPDCPQGDTPAIVAVDGDFTHEATLHIQGCRFGTKQQAEPQLYDTVDNQPAYSDLAVGDRIPTETTDAPWTENHDSAREYVRFATENPRDHRTAFYRVSGGANGGDGALGWPRALGATNPPADQRLLYVSWWYRPSMGPGAGEPAGSNKFIRVWDHSGGDGTRISWTQMHLTYPGSQYTAWTGWSGQVGEWNRMEIVIDADRGTIRHYVNGAYQQVSNSSVGEFDIDDFVKDADYSQLGLNVAVIGFDHGSSSYGEMVTDFGEVYIDTTRARVEIGDAPTWSATRHREVQIAERWGENAIEIRLNEGSFDGLSGRYLYVIDSEGRVNQDGFSL